MTQPLLPTMNASVFDNPAYRVPCPKCSGRIGEKCKNGKGGYTSLHVVRKRLSDAMSCADGVYDETNPRDRIVRSYALMGFPVRLYAPSDPVEMTIVIQVAEVATHVMSRRECGIHDGWEIPASFKVIAESALACDADHIIDPDTGELDEILARLVVLIIAKNQDF